MCQPTSVLLFHVVLACARVERVEKVDLHVHVCIACIVEGNLECILNK